MSHTRQEQMEAFGRFLNILDELRVKWASQKYEASPTYG